MTDYTNLDYCPFCGNGATDDGISINTRPHRLGVKVYIKCGHCSAQGGTFIDETKEDAIASAIRDWNQKDIRPNTFCHKVKSFFGQLEYDIRTCWGRY